MALELFSVSAAALFFLFVFTKMANQVGLVDAPNQRKRHTGQIPLVGGLAVTLAILGYLVLSSNEMPYVSVLTCSMFILLVMGVIDDKYDLSCKLRLTVQAGLTTFVALATDIKLISFGNAFGLGYTELEWLALPMTVIAVIGAINAFNMVDGIDGLLGCLACITFASLGALFTFYNDPQHALFCTVIIAALLPYIAMNLGWLGHTRKVFMGDAGSMVIGFMVIWLLFTISQPSLSAIDPMFWYQWTAYETVRPVTVLWLIAVPLMDMVAIMARRIKRGVSPMTPDREHLHHIFQRIGFNRKQTLLIICSIATGYALFGVYGEVKNISEPTMFYLFLVCFGLYYVLLSKIWRITAYIRLLRKEQRGKKTFEPIQ
ncbi:UDP-N-acetylglucosamine--undecaprenyl-phosphate N-acetylglucosaminephosphotransferase [Vibrio mediterranei]|uniref:UDP-N-acetylglucosamine--undecaprenyl-phosphate N-acetylglucosaminephosphotransferase n=1 Tax=Vibrio mediterranei TaxID=689 RepID=UPI00148DDCC6|nr:UDP-N-acetylglucosamine--undecaprenyl-phosphate N-acetylglucosaminephosphotransferase [Vibrio mediterranei]NOI24001.1 UDP-N-acetylglucosamine--undecaprenyl-phosphate N-acetylglucosaminephosphotransferase [Vibrio mediterranei]